MFIFAISFSDFKNAVLSITKIGLAFLILYFFLGPMYALLETHWYLSLVLLAGLIGTVIFLIRKQWRIAALLAVVFTGLNLFAMYLASEQSKVLQAQEVYTNLYVTTLNNRFPGNYLWPEPVRSWASDHRGGTAGVNSVTEEQRITANKRVYASPRDRSTSLFFVNLPYDGGRTAFLASYADLEASQGDWLGFTALCINKMRSLPEMSEQCASLEGIQSGFGVDLAGAVDHWLTGIEVSGPCASNDVCRSIEERLGFSLPRGS